MTDRPAAPPKVRIAAIAGVAAGGLLWSSPGPRLPPSVELHVPGAISVHVYCGGETFMTAKGVFDTLTFSPDGARCDVEAPLSPVMPLRGTLEIGGGDRYRCVRQGIDLICGLAPAGA